MQAAVLLLALAGGAITGAWAFLQPAADTLSAAEERGIELGNRLAHQRDAAAGLAVLERQVAKLEARADEARRRLPAQAGVSDVLGLAARHARQQGLAIERFQPGAVRDALDYKTRLVEVAITGDWRGLMRFLRALSQGPRLLTAEDLRIDPAGAEGDDKDQRLRLAFSLGVHWRPAADAIASDPPTASPAAAANPPPLPPSLARNPFRPRAEADAVSLPASLRYLGHIAAGSARWALLRTGSGDILRLQAGDRLPLSSATNRRWQIERISAKAIVLTATTDNTPAVRARLPLAAATTAGE